MNQYRLTVVVIVLALALLGNSAAGQSIPTNTNPITLTNHTTRAINTYGLAVPKDQVSLRAAVDGHVAQIFFEEGQTVKQGDVVIELECQPARARLKIAQLESANTGVLQNANAVLAVAESNFKRISALHRQQASSELEFNEARLRLDTATAAVKIEQERLATNQARAELAAAELEQFLLRAPFDGQIVQVQTSAGESVSQTNDLIQIVSLDKYRVDLFLPIDRANELTVGQTIQVRINAPFNRAVPATLLFRSPLIEAATGTTRVTLEIDNRQLKLPAGFTASLDDVM